MMRHLQQFLIFLRDYSETFFTQKLLENLPEIKHNFRILNILKHLKQ